MNKNSDFDDVLEKIDNMTKQNELTDSEKFLKSILNEETDASYADALYTRIFKKETAAHTDGNNNSYKALNDLRAKSKDKIYKNSETGETYTTPDDFATGVCEYYKERYPENFEQYKDTIKRAAIDRFNRH